MPTAARAATRRKPVRPAAPRHPDNRRTAAHPANPANPSHPSTRDRLLAAAAAEFAARGFAGANVDRIARAARVNKAMIYYHFASKAALYREILGDMFRAVCGRVRVVADSSVTPEEKLRGFISTIAAEAQSRPHFPPTWFREIAEGGAHLDDETLRDIAAIVAMLAGIVGEGVAAGRFQPVNPLLVHGGIVGPVLLFFASAPLRQRIEKAGLGNVTQLTSDEVVAHVERVTLALLGGTAANRRATVAQPRRRVGLPPSVVGVTKEKLP
jgi:TetR/AcrR family transcriptional regulator